MPEPAVFAPEPEGGMSVESAIDLYDHERLAIRDKVQPGINASIGSKRSIQGFVDEVINRFHTDAGLIVEVTVWENEAANAIRPKEERLYGFKVYISGRVQEEEEFDHERMSHEVRSDLLGLRGGDDRTNISTSLTGTSGSKLWVPGGPN